MKLDARDIAILRVLSQNGRITKAALAEAIGLSAAAAWDRLQRLENAGIIEGYAAQISLKRLGPHVTIFVTVELKNHQAADFQRFEGEVARHEEIIEVWSLGGGIDYLLKTVTRDIDQYQRLMDHLLGSYAGISRYTTHIVTKAVKQSSPELGMLSEESSV